MSMSRQKLLRFLGAIAAAFVLWGAVHVLWYKPRANELHKRLTAATETVRDYQSALDARPRLQRQIRDIVDRSLGEDVETVDHRLRTRLNRIAEELQLAGATVSTVRPSVRQSPARLALPRGATELRDEVDFIELDGTIAGEGTIEQVIALVDRIEAEPWIKRIHAVRLDPKNNGERFGVSVRLTTLFLPGRVPDQAPPVEYDMARLTKFASVVQGNPFRLPPPVVAEAPAAQPKPAAPPKPRVEQWTVTGIAHGPAGTEAWLRNANSGELRTVALGQNVHAAVFVGANGDTVEFEVNQERLVVLVGDVFSVPMR